MRSTSLALILLCAAPLSAQPSRWTAYPRLLGRTGRNMVTFHDKFAAFEEWAQIAMAFHDGWTTDQVNNHHLPNFRPYESNPLFGRHPSTLRIFGEGSFLSFNEAAFTQTTHEHIDGRSAWEWNLVPLGVSALHEVHAVMNQHICDQICK